MPRASASRSRSRALSLRSIEAEYGIGRAFVSQLVRGGVLPGIRRGKTVLVLREDWEQWWRTEAARQREAQGHAAAVVARRLAREEAKGAGP